MDIKIRQANNGDLDDIVNFQKAMALETENLELSKEILEQGVQHLYENPAIGSYIVAEVNGDVVASTLTLKEWSDWRNGDVLWIHSVFVIPEFRGKGVFRKIYEFVKREVEGNEGFKGIRLYVDRTNENAQQVYRALDMNGDHYQVFEWMKDY